MHIYFSGIGGTGIGPLAEISLDAGYTISGSDISASPMTSELEKRGVKVYIGQDGTQIEQAHNDTPIDWVVYTSALADDHPELLFAQERGIKATKRDELLAHIITDKSMKLISVAGTHGKTTTTGMLLWLFKQTSTPVSYSIGTTISFGQSGKFDANSEYFVYECDEYDRNFLHFSPHLSVLPSVDYDHPNTYPTVDDYKLAFNEFIDQSDWTICYGDTSRYLGLGTRPNLSHPNEAAIERITLAGEHNRRNALLAVTAMSELTDEPIDTLIDHINTFPGTDRRFEKLSDNLYSDYGHHPIEIAATLQMAREINERVVLVYQPHQNLRQHELKDQYGACMELAEKVYWLPTYLSREDPSQEILSPTHLINGLADPSKAEPAEPDENLWQSIADARNAGKLVLVMGAGTIDAWVRDQLHSD